MDEKDHQAKLAELATRYPQLRAIFAKPAKQAVCIPLMEDGQKVIDNWELIMGHVSMAMDIGMVGLPKLIKDLKVDLISDAGLPKNIAIQICEALYHQLTDEANFEEFIDNVTSQMTPENFNDEDTIFDLFANAAFDYSGQYVSDIIGSFDEKNSPGVDTMSAWMDIFHDVFLPIIRQIPAVVASFVDDLDELINM